MFGINQILSKVINRQSLRIETEVVKYLITKLNNLYIEVLGEYEGTIFELMPFGKLEGWCWQTTESAIVFLNGDDYIERGNLYLDEKTPQYYHSWICFNYNGTEYVLDPCLSFLCKKKDYSRIFQTDVKSRIFAKTVKEELIRRVTTPKEDDTERNQYFEKFLSSFFRDSYKKYKEEKKDEVIISGPEDINTPFYRNGAGYITKLEDGKIKKLTIHYYRTDC